MQFSAAQMRQDLSCELILADRSGGMLKHTSIKSSMGCKSGGRPLICSAEKLWSQNWRGPCKGCALDGICSVALRAASKLPPMAIFLCSSRCVAPCLFRSPKSSIGPGHLLCKLARKGLTRRQCIEVPLSLTMQPIMGALGSDPDIATLSEGQLGSCLTLSRTISHSATTLPFPLTAVS